MRLLRLIPLLLAVAVVWALNRSFGSLPPIGRIIDPVNGAICAAEPADEDWNRHIRLKDLRAPVSIWLDSSLIAHIRAGNDHDLYYAQGYLHASFRLWQMDLQTRAAGGRVSEVAGPKAIDFDRGMRREGMVWGAQRSLATMEAEPRTKAMLDAYRDGINAYVHTLNYRRLPVEYKLMGFYPEEWTNLRTALLMKYMARDLTGKTDDIAYTQLRDKLGQEQFDFLFPERIKGSKPVIPEGTKFEKPCLKAPTVPSGDVWAHFDTSRDKKTASAGGIRSGVPLVTAPSALATSNCALATSRKALEASDNALSTSHIALEGSHTALDASHIALEGSCTPLARSDNALAASRSALPACDNRGNAAEGAQMPGEESGIGSNNWAISGSHTASGKPILCNDPHLALNLPSLWYEMQLTAPGINAYGASLPGAPGIVIGFNETISWGFTNNYRDVKDFYQIDSRSLRVAEATTPMQADTSATPGVRDWVRPVTYSFCGNAIPFQKGIEVIKVKGGSDIIDTVLYTIHGPVTYDPSFPAPGLSPTEAGGGSNTGAGRGAPLLACTWMGHRGSNELLATYLLNRAGDYAAFTDAISHFECPAQNIAYADVAGNIAMWGQGRFINKWKDQGKYVMRGTDSSTLWGDAIPWQENPHVLNPPQGYVASANQQVADSTYPYWYNGSFVEWRSWEINEILHELQDFRPFEVVGSDISGDFLRMKEMQNNVSSKLVFELRSSVIGHFFEESDSSLIPALHYSHDSSHFTPGWELNPENEISTFYQILVSELYKDIWQDDFPNSTKWPSSEFTVQLLLSDSTSGYYDDKRTQQVETLRDIVQRAFKETTDSLDRLTRRNAPRRVPTTATADTGSALQWYRVKNTSLTHLAKIPAFSYDHLKIGGWSNTINACTGDHGPSWRMIVEMDSIPKAYAIYPGGQSGNPGSRHYSDFIDQWVEGKYHAIQFITAAVIKNPFTYTWTLNP